MKKHSKLVKYTMAGLALLGALAPMAAKAQEEENNSNLHNIHADQLFHIIVAHYNARYSK